MKHHEKRYRWIAKNPIMAVGLIVSVLCFVGLFIKNAEAAPSQDACNGAPVGAVCQRVNAKGGTDTVVVAQTNALYVWPTDEPIIMAWNNGSNDGRIAGNPNYFRLIGKAFKSSQEALTDMSGMDETNALVNQTDIGAPYAAAKACRAHGPDWYLPALGELDLILKTAGEKGVGSLVMHMTHLPVPANYPENSMPGSYWSATEYWERNAWSAGYIDMSALMPNPPPNLKDAQGNVIVIPTIHYGTNFPNKRNYQSVRCIRK